MPNDEGGGIPQVTFLKLVGELVQGVGNIAMDPLAATKHVVVKQLVHVRRAVKAVIRMTLVGDILLGHGRYVNGIVHGKWYATALPDAVVSAFCAGTLFINQKETSLGHRDCRSYRFGDLRSLLQRHKICRNVLNCRGLFDGSL